MSFGGCAELSRCLAVAGASAGHTCRNNPSQCALITSFLSFQLQTPTKGASDRGRWCSCCGKRGSTFDRGVFVLGYFRKHKNWKMSGISDKHLPSNFWEYLCLVKEFEKYFQKCYIFYIDFRLRISPKYSHLIYEITIFLWDENIFSYKKTNLFLLSSTTTHRRWSDGQLLSSTTGPPSATALC